MVNVKPDRARDLPPRLRKLVDQGKVVVPTRTMRDVLTGVGRPPGTVTDAGTRALQEQRGDRA